MKKDIEAALEKLRMVQDATQADRSLTSLLDLVTASITDLEHAQTGATIKNYPYFMTWLKELGQKPSAVARFGMKRHMIEVHSDNIWKNYEPLDKFTAHLLFKDGTYLERTGTFSDGTMSYVPVDEEDA